MKVTTQYANLDASAQGASLPRGAALHAVDASDVVQPHGWHAPAADNDAQPDGLLSRTEFLRMVQREKRRTDRSHSALSLAILDIDIRKGGVLDALLGSVSAMVRETDYLASIDGECIAVLLPDTGEAGLRSFLDKVALQRNSHTVSTAGATYLDAAFDRLVTERLGTPRSRHPVDAEEKPVVRSSGYPLKRALDICGATVALLLLLPLMLLVALAIKLTSRGPVIFRQKRVGQGGESFVMYKFRSMRTDMDDRAHREFVAKLIDGKQAARADAPAAAEFKMKADPRVTRIGRLIRMTSFNVLQGTMSLVGPRPPVPYEAEMYKTWHRRRVFEMKPGLTGIWQVEGRSKVSFDEMVRMDLRYLRLCSLRFDLGILLRTVRVVLTCDGAQ
jgi:lipopolysaccharide/colanic/teichoic acid biosynthesis glycosyltransferase